MNMDVTARFMAKVDVTDGCWEWLGASAGKGYGSFCFGGRAGLAHRWSYERFVGPIPEGLHIDHLCRNRGCVNPLHLEPVTPGENVMRGETITAANAAKTHCPQGHPYEGHNLKYTREGWRQCRACHNRRNRLPDQEKRGSSSPGLQLNSAAPTPDVELACPKCGSDRVFAAPHSQIPGCGSCGAGLMEVA